MKMAVKLGIVMIVATSFPFVAPVQAAPRFVGAEKCKICHNRKDQVNQYEIWSHSKHANAYATLATPKAKELAAKAGVKGDPQKAAECVECHVTGYGLDTSHFAASFVREAGVQCEACHGPGSEYKSPSIMSSAKYASGREEQHKQALNAGLVIPDEKTCVKCHNKRSPAYKEFEFKEFYERIKHKYNR